MHVIGQAPPGCNALLFTVLYVGYFAHVYTCVHYYPIGSRSECYAAQIKYERDSENEGKPESDGVEPDKDAVMKEEEGGERARMDLAEEECEGA